jgi:hypothetical protein
MLSPELMAIESWTEQASGAVAKMNMPRLIFGGLVAGVVLNVITGVANARILDESFNDWSRGMGTHLHPPAQSVQICSWLLMGLLDGAAGVIIYAGMLPRYGAGTKTALLAGLLVWVVGRLCVAFDMFALGVFPWRFLAGQTILGLIAIVPSVLAGAWIYRE